MGMVGIFFGICVKKRSPTSLNRGSSLFWSYAHHPTLGIAWGAVPGRLVMIAWAI